ncbi:MAG: hypothetical protein DRP63_09390 [Planctomycetota bacterium]|nr:MAG: hypothetical protein DRP63_09390 [Planctomycetota bacterium]
MRCDEVKNLLALASGGDVSDEEWRIVERHMAECPSCRRLYMAFCEDRARIESLRGLRLRGDLSAALAARRRHILHPYLGWVMRFVVAAAVALAITLFVVKMMPTTQAPSSHQPSATVFVNDTTDFVRKAFENATVKDMPRSTPKYERCRVLEEADATVDF